MEKDGLGLRIIIHGFMEIQMVFRQVGEYGIVEFTACHSSKNQGMGGNLHAHILHLFLCHPGQDTVKVDNIGRGIVGGNFLITDKGMNSADNAGFMAGMVKDMGCHMGGSGFAICTGQRNHAHFSCGIIKEKGYHIFHGLPGIFDIYHGNGRRYVYVPGSYNGSSSLFYSSLNEIMAIHMGTGKADKQTALYYHTGISSYIFNFNIRRTGYFFHRSHPNQF